VWRRTRATFNQLPKAELLYADVADLKRIIDRIVHFASDEEIIVAGRQGPGYETLYVAFSKLRYSYRTERDLRRALGEAFGPVAVATSVSADAVRVLIFYFDSAALDHPLDMTEARRVVVSLVTTWEDQISEELERAFGEREGRRLLRRYVTSQTRSGLYRAVTAPADVPADLERLERLERLETRLDVRIVPRTEERVTVILYAVRSLDLTDILKTMQNLGLTVVEELCIPLDLPDGRRCLIYRFQVEAPAQRIAALLEAEARVDEALRALDEERATDDPLNALILSAGLGWRDVEVLGLMKTQMVKNSVIVPVGSKGGFVLKGEVPLRPALDGYLVDRYREYVSGLLDVTDNRENGRILHPPEVARLDGDDAYLVVAADKGTAHLSDTANLVSSQYSFWLGDAFASGGSVGYDHKKMGITARGEWECVHHHFRTLGLEIQTDPFTVAAIGDMGGDVFGNGMLLSPAIRLVAAFNHVNIFLDPNPDPEKSLAERQRLFELPRSSWRDYDKALISKGGGVFDRSAKAIPISEEVRALLEIETRRPSGEEVVRKILTARVDLLYNGGIGTYVKAAAEEHVEVGDRSNDRVRVDARDVRARVVGEGGNLGFTQRARLEYWAAGGRINTDAVDNSGGVDASDHEVNIKILLDMLSKKGLIEGRKERNRIFLEMTDDVSDLVLADNLGQARAISLDRLRSGRDYEAFVDLIDDMAGAGLLNRKDEFVPRRKNLLSSSDRKRGLPRPLLGVLLGYGKISASQLLLETDFPDTPAARPFLDGYFPALLRERFSDHFEAHVLRREIVATVAINYVVNRGGVTLLPRLTGGGGDRPGRCGGGVGRSGPRGGGGCGSRGALRLGPLGQGGAQGAARGRGRPRDRRTPAALWRQGEEGGRLFPPDPKAFRA